MNANTTDAEDKPLDPAVERVRRRMMRLMAVSVVIMMTGLIAVIGAIVYKLQARGDAGAPAAPGAAAIEGRIALPKEARVVSSSLSGGDLLLVVDPGGGQRLQFWVYRIAENRIAAKISID
jgi:hypothetical protein